MSNINNIKHRFRDKILIYCYTDLLTKIVLHNHLCSKNYYKIDLIIVIL